MKKVLLVSGGDVARGGVQIFLLQWLKAACEKYEFYWYFLGENKDIALFETIKSYTSYIFLGNHRKEPAIQRYWHLCQDLSHLLKEKNFDIIHVNTGGIVVQALSMHVAVQNNIVTRIAHSHFCPKVNSHIVKWGCSFFQNYLRRKATCCAACSTDAGISLFGEKILLSQKWKRIQNTIDTGKYLYNKEIRSIYRKKIEVSSHFVMGCIGILNENKNQILTIRLLKRLRDKGVQNIRLILIGIDTLDGKLKKEAELMGVDDSVIFLGVSDCVEKWLQAMDIFLMPSMAEGLPISALEAQAAGLPCVLSDRISREVRISRHTEFVPIENMEQWVSAVAKYMQLQYDRKKESEFCCMSGIDISQIPTYVDSLYNNT